MCKSDIKWILWILESVEVLNLKELFIDMYCPLWMFLVGSFGLDLLQGKLAKRLRLS